MRTRTPPLLEDTMVLSADLSIVLPIGNLLGASRLGELRRPRILHDAIAQIGARNKWRPVQLEASWQGSLELRLI